MNTSSFCPSKRGKSGCKRVSKLMPCSPSFEAFSWTSICLFYILYTIPSKSFGCLICSRVHTYIHVCIYIYITHTQQCYFGFLCVCVSVYICVYVCVRLCVCVRERERERER